MAELLEHLQNVIHELRNKQGNALLRAASGLTVPNSRLCQLATKRDTVWLEKQQQRDTKKMTFTSPFQPQPLCDSDGSICGYQTYSTEGPKTAGENATQNHSNLEAKMDSRVTKQNNSNAPGRKKDS